MSVEASLRKSFTVGLAVSLILFILSLTTVVVGADPLSYYLSVTSTLVLIATPMIGLFFLAMDFLRRGDLNGLLSVAIMVSAILMGILIALIT
ncbi:MAG: hypothetical protein QFX33_05240 [Candidatus Nezhaarchaeota archaeon]|nr:hypothetical protein [Candidatus Nezhaarchaeota archaeon]